MSNMTPEQIKGTKFEIWLEDLLYDHGYKPRRNVEFHKRRQGHRQADIMYKILKGNKEYLAILEAKYSSNGVIPNRLRTPKEVKIGQESTQQLSTIVDDLVERQEFIERHFYKIDHIFLVTNKQFDDEVKIAAPQNGIIIVEGPELAKMHLKRGGTESIDDSISKIDYRRYILLPINEYRK